MQITFKNNICIVKQILNFSDVCKYIAFTKKQPKKDSKAGGIFVDVCLQDITILAYILLKIHLFFKEYYLVSLYHTFGSKRTLIFAKNSEESYKKRAKNKQNY